jgi:hypothetical protein
MTRISTCPRCKSHLVKEVNESEIFGVSKTRGHVYNAMRKGIHCLICGYRDIRFGMALQQKGLKITEYKEDIPKPRRR